jgi:CDP-glycerol glycerophosphotransferase
MKFSFVKANAAKIVLLPLYAVLGVLAMTMPRNARLWAFGRKSGFGEGPLRVLEEVRRRHPDIRVVWLAQNAHDLSLAEAAGVESYLKTSFRALWVTVRAAVLVITHGLGDVFRPAAPGARVIQLWHGTPLKLIGLDAPSTYQIGGNCLGRALGALLIWPYRATYRIPTVYVAASVLSARRFQSAFGIAESKLLKIGDPRCDCLQVANGAEARAMARVHLAKLWAEQDLPERLFLYAPTWRDGDVDPGVPSSEERAVISEVCRRLNAYLVIRSHPHGYGMDGLSSDTVAAQCFRFLPAEAINDATPYLHGIDGLVTDYSAIAIDYALLERPIYFFAPDLADYVKARGLYEPYADFTGNHWSNDWHEVALAIQADAEDRISYEKRCDRTRSIKTRHHLFGDGGASKRLVEHLVRSS